MPDPAAAPVPSRVSLGRVARADRHVVDALGGLLCALGDQVGRLVQVELNAGRRRGQQHSPLAHQARPADQFALLVPAQRRAVVDARLSVLLYQTVGGGGRVIRLAGLLRVQDTALYPRQLYNRAIADLSCSDEA